MSNKVSFSEWVRGIISTVAWRVFLWAERMTDEQYTSLVHTSCDQENADLRAKLELAKAAGYRLSTAFAIRRSEELNVVDRAAVAAWVEAMWKVRED